MTSPTYLVTCLGSHLRNVTLRSFFLPLTHELYAVTLEGRTTQRTNLNTMRTNHNCSVLHKPSTSPITSSSIIHSVAAYRVHPSKKLQRGYPYIYIRQSESGLPLQATIIEREGFDLPTCTHLHAVVPAPCDPWTLGYSEGPRSRLFLLGPLFLLASLLFLVASLCYLMTPAPIPAGSPPLFVPSLLASSADSFLCFCWLSLFLCGSSCLFLALYLW